MKRNKPDVREPGRAEDLLCSGFEHW